MEKEMCNNPAHDKSCGWCGLDKGFSWKRLILAVLIGMFIFFAGIQIGEMRGEFGQYGQRGMMMHQRWGNQDQDYQIQMMNTTPGEDGLGVPTQPSAPATVTVPAPTR